MPCRLAAREKALAEAQKRVLAAESQVNDLQARLNDALNQRRHFEDEYSVRYLFGLLFITVYSMFICLFNVYLCIVYLLIVYFLTWSFVSSSIFHVCTGQDSASRCSLIRQGDPSLFL